MTAPTLTHPAVGDRLSFDLGAPGRRALQIPQPDVPETPPLPQGIARTRPARLPELSQVEVVRYFYALSQLNYGVDSGFYPLGSCTMKYNPKINDEVAALPGFAHQHPLQPDASAQGTLAVLHALQCALCELTGMASAALSPFAGAQGEFAGMLVIKAYHAARGEGERRRKVLVPDSAHGTNPATAAMCGYEVVSVPSDVDGNIDLDALSALADETVAALMLTMPTTLGLFDPRIDRITAALHEHGIQIYGDGANLNAIVGRACLGDMGFDVVHSNLHKTFSTPHGGGGPGAGPIVVKEHLAPFLPTPVVIEEGGQYSLHTPAQSIGRLGAFQGNVGVLIRAYTYIRALGLEGLRSVSENAVINANYIRVRLSGMYRLPYDRACMHEVVFSASWQKARYGVRTIDIAKRLIDYGFHPPTTYFPLIVDEALMIEPTESEPREGLDAFCEAMLCIAAEAEAEPETVRGAPHTAPLRRLDEALAARRPVLRWTPERATQP